MIIFLDITTFKTFRKVVDDTDDEITDTTWKNLQLKWTFPIDAGNVIFNADAGLGPNEDQGEFIEDAGRASNRERGISRIVLPKPAMLTGQSSKILAYSLDYIIDPVTIILTPVVINPDVDNDGNDLIRKLESEDGLIWTVATDDGTVEDLTPAELKPGKINLLTQSLDITQDVFPSPFLLFNRANIA